VPEREAAEHGLRRGTENPPRGNGERKGRRRPDPLLRNGGDPGEAVLQVPSFRPHSEGVQEQGAVLQVLQEGHRKSECTAEAKRCPNCVRARRGQRNHGATDRKCPEDDAEDDAAEGEQNRKDLNGTGEYSHNTRDNLVVFQVNLGRGREATDLQKTAEEQKADVVLIQESYCYMPTWVGWTKYGGGRTDKIATLVRTGRRSIELTQFTGPTTRTVVIEGARGDIAFSNVYVPPKGPLEGTLTVLEELLASRRGKPTMIAGDLNRRHPAFGGEEEDVRGRQIIDLVGAANLVVENDRDSIPTFETANGKSWIDITLSRDATVESWAVREEETLSDHKSIFFSVDIGEMGNDQPRERKRIMMVHQADWQLFRDAKGATFEEDTAEDMASALQGLAMRACKARIPCGIRRERKGNVWWSAKLRRIRAGVRKAGSQMQGERNQERRAELRETFKKERAAYKMAIKEAKIEALRKALAQGSPEDPWGLAYKLVTSKKRGAATPWTSIQDEGNWAGNRTETAMALIRK
jgi:hypothetical protein